MSIELTGQNRNRILSWALNLTGLFILLLLLYLGGVDAWRQLLKADWRYLLAALGLTLLWNLLAAYRWSMLADRVTGEPGGCPFRYYFAFHMIGMITGQVLPIAVGMLGGRPVALALSRGVPLRRAAVSVFLDKLLDLILAVLLLGPAAFYLVGWIALPLAVGLMVGLTALGALALGTRYDRGIRAIESIVAHLAHSLARLPLVGQRLGGRLPEQLDRLAVDSPIPNYLMVRAFLVTVGMYLLLSLRLYCVSQALRLDIPWVLMVMGTGVTQLTLVFAFTPGSLGFLEGGFAAVLGLGGISQAQILVFVIGRRAFFLILTALCAVLAFGWIRESPARLFRAVIGASQRPAKEPTALAGS